jgi:hypothetical protein
MPKLFCFKDDETFNYLFFYFWFGLLFCRLLWSGFGELVSMMERNPCYSIDNLHSECESRLLKMIGIVLSREWKDVDEEKLYEAN